MNIRQAQLPRGWEIKKLSEVCALSAGGDVPKNNFSEIPTEKHQIPIYANGEKNEGFYGYTSIAKVTKPSITVSARGTIGFSVKRLEAFFPVVRLIVVTPINLNELDLDYLDYALKTIDFKHSGSSIPQLTVPMIRDYEIPLPPLSEQQHIVSILDEAFAAIDKAKANAEQNLKNAKELFESYLQGVFDKKGDGWEETTLENEIDLLTGFAFKSKYYTDSDRDILLVRGDNIMQGYFRWEDAKRWSIIEFDDYKKFQLCENDVVLAMDRPWVKAGLKCAMISKKELPSLLVQRTASLRCKPNLNSLFLFDLVKSKSFTAHLLGVQTGIGVPHISGKQILLYPFYKPPIEEQQTIVRQLDALRAETQKLEAVYQKKLNDLEDLKKSILQKAFAGELTTSISSAISVAKVTPLQKIEGISPTDLQAGITAMALQKHIEQNQQHSFHHVKTEKIVHLAEYILNIDLERNPVKDAAGPNDFPHAKKVESRARKAGFYTVFKNGDFYDYQKGRSISVVIQKTQNCLGEKANTLSQIIDILLPMSTQQAEILATVYAAWNNLILNGNTFSNEDIVTEARENWHKNKLSIEREKFYNALEWMKNNELLIPRGNGKIVDNKKLTKSDSSTAHRTY